MATTRQRTQVTHTPDIEMALTIAMKRWPNEKPSVLLGRLIKEGAKTVEASEDAAAVARRCEVQAVSAEFAGIYPEGYLAELRAEWPE